MSNDRYARVLLTVIAGALVYLCVVLTPWPAAQAQTARRPGDPTGPGEVVIVGWRAPQSDRVPIVATAPLPVAVTGPPLQITGQVTTERSSGRADRVVLVGWEERASAAASRAFHSLEVPTSQKETAFGLPVTVVPR